MKKITKKIKLVQINSELGAGTRGASKGVSGLLKASLDFKRYVFEEYSMVFVPHANEVLKDPVRFKYAKRITELLPVFKRVSDLVKLVLRSGDTPVVLAGDHSTAVGTIAGVKSAYPDARIGVIWIDAHADIHSPYTTPSGNMHGMPIAASLNIDNKLKGQNTPHVEVVEKWELLKRLNGIQPKIEEEDLVYVGVRDTEWQEDQLLESLKIMNVSIEELRSRKVHQTVALILNQLKSVDHIYISYDVDVLDPSLSRGTGTPVDNGLFLDEVKELLSKLCQSPKVVCFEMVEINPLLDEGNKMAEMAFEVLEVVIQSLESR